MKTKKRSKILSLLLALSMLVGMVPFSVIPASAADDTSYTKAEIRGYKSFESYLRSSDSRDLKLMEDIDYTVGINDLSIDVIRNQKLDLNGHKITIDASRRAGFVNLLCIRRGEFTLYDSKGGGELAVSFPNDDKAYSIIMMSSEKKDEPSKFTMNGGTLTKLHPNMTYTYGASGCIGDDYFNKPENGKRSQITINGGTINCPYEWDRSQSLLDFEVEAMPLALQLLYSNLTINGGTFNGIVWTDTLWRGEQDTEPRVVLNGGEFNSPFVVEGMQKDATQIVIDGAHFKDGFHVNNGYSINTDVGTVPVLLLKSGVFDSPDKNPKLDIYNVTANSYGNGVNPDATARARLEMILHAMKCFPNSAIKVNGKFYTSENIESLVGKNNDDFYLKLNSSTPIEVIRDAWGVMESVTLDNVPIDYFKDWKGTVERMDNSKDHTIKFKWKPLAAELSAAGYSYRATCDRYISGNKTPTTDTISATANEYSFTIPAGADPKVYSFDLHLNLKKGDKNIGIISNEHIVKLVVNQAPVVEPDPTLTGNVYYTSGIVFGRSISTGTSGIPDGAVKAYQWQRRTNDGEWTDIDGETSGKYTPVAADMGDTVRIRVKITAEGYLGEIVGAAVKVSKAANNNYPEVIKLETVKNGAGNYNGFKITNFDSDCEYVYSTTDTPNWSANQITSATVTGLTSDTTYYVFARFKETATHTAGSIVSKNSIKLYDNVPLDRVLLEGYGSHGTIYIKKGESVTLKVSADPSNANYWNEITFKDEGATTSNIAISNGNIAASTGTATPFPNGHTITITGVSKGSANLRASYPSATSSAYGTWNVVVYDDSTVANALRLESVYAYEDITLSENDTAELPTTNLPKLLPENSGYHLEWRILKRGTYGASYVTENENIKLEDGKIIKPKAAHTGSEKAQLELVAVKDGSTEYKTLPKTSLFYVTVTEAPVIELTGITVAPTKVNLDLNATYQLSAVKEPVNAAGSLSWESSNPGVATVDSTGKVTAKAQGTAIITVSCGDKKATCTVTVDHQHDYTGQPYLYLDPGNHYQECKAGDGYNIQAHEFTAWTDNGNGTHSRHCTVCKMTDGSTYTETAEHTWVWVVDQEAALGQPGKQHEECTGCHAKRSENTEIPALRDYAVTVTGGTATVAAGTPITRAMEGVEVTVTAQAPAGKHFVKWVVKAGGVTLANETSATTTFIMPANDVTIEAKLVENPFVDVSESSVYYDAILWAYYHEPQQITGGYTATEFRPGNPCTRGQVVTFLWRAAGCPEPTGDTSMFNDASSIAAPYQKAVAWAVEKGITTGFADGTFRPNDSVTRAQFVTFLWRYENRPATSGSIAGFTDASSIAEPYQQAVAWAVEKGITTGYNDGSFRPNATCTRWAVVLFMYRDMT